MSMHRYDTPRHKFVLPYKIANISKLYIVYKQHGEVLFEKKLSDCEIVDEYTVRVHLLQEDSGKFSACEHSHKPEVQITFLTNGNERFTSNNVKFTVEESFKDGVI